MTEILPDPQNKRFRIFFPKEEWRGKEEQVNEIRKKILHLLEKEFGCQRKKAELEEEDGGYFFHVRVIRQRQDLLSCLKSCLDRALRARNPCEGN